MKTHSKFTCEMNTNFKQEIDCKIIPKIDPKGKQIN